MILNLDVFFNPRSIALVGASDKLSSWGFIVTHNIIRNKYQGRFFPINPNKKEVLGYKTYPSLLDIPKDIELDLVIIIIRAKAVLSILEQVKKRDVHHVIIISGGFRESGEEGLKLEESILTYAKQNNIYLIGPNGMGIVSTRVSLSAVMWPVYGLKEGFMTFISQSGNIGTIGISVASKKGIGLNVYVSTGNMADLTMSDYLEYFGKQDSKSKVIGFYIEGIKNARRFVSLVKEISKIKPIIILKAGGSKAGKKAAKSHTGAITGDDLIFKSILENSGAIVVESLEEMFDLFSMFSRWVDWNFPRGKVIILTLGGGWGVMAADSCSKYGIILEPLNKSIYNKINKILPPYWSKGNPIDTVASLNLNSLQEIMEIIFEEMPSVEAIFLLGIGGFSFLSKLAKESPLIPNDQKYTLDIIIEAELNLFKKIISLSDTYHRPILITTLLTHEDSPAIKYIESQDYPIFPSPERMVKAFRYLVNYYNWKQRI